MTLAAGSKLAAYEILSPLGEGRMGEEGRELRHRSMRRRVHREFIFDADDIR
jgi:hypothetical protein